LTFRRIADTDGIEPAWGAAKPGSIEESSAAGMPLPATSAIAIRKRPSPSGTTS